MDIQMEKHKLMEWLISLNDESIISKIKKIKNSVPTNSDWTDDVSNTEKSLIKTGLKDLKEGNTLTHEQVMKEINEVYNI